MAEGVLCVEDIVATASFDVRVLAGNDGLRREVLWAHSCEMKDPKRFLGPHELLMTVGLCVPADPTDQVAFVADLDEAGLAGFMIGDHDPAPPLSAEMFAEADRRGFPILLAGEHVAYAVVARHVAAANSSTQSLQVLKLSKLYHVATYAERDLHSLVTELVGVLRVGIAIEDTTTGLELVRVGHGPTTSVGEARQQRHRLRGTHAIDLVLIEYPNEEVDSFLLVHLTKMLEVATDSVLNAADRRAEVSARLFTTLLNGAAPEDTSIFFRPHKPSDGFTIAAFGIDHLAAIRRAVSVATAPVLVAVGQRHGLALIPVGATPLFRTVVEKLGARVGLSSVFIDFADTRIAAVEAADVLATAAHSEQLWNEFEGSTLSVLTRSRREASEIVTGVLGPLADPSSRSTMLRVTLFCYLKNDRRWDETAAELGIHRQTLSYRLRRIADETGRDLSRTADLSALWIACHAWESLERAAAQTQDGSKRSAASTKRSSAGH
jgi:PucR family transcriptional regulator, purine catabolism regulatory protein